MSSGDDETMDMLAFFKLLGKLKHLPRAGWVRHNVQSPETVACHMYRMSVMAFFFDEKNSQNLSQTKCIKMALVHDMAESLVGDITPHDGVDDEEKFRLENEGMTHIRKLVPKKIGDELYDLWREYEAQQSPEAKAVKDLDKFDMIMQAYEYETSTDKKKSLQEFFISRQSGLNEQIFSTDLVRQWAKRLSEERDEQK